MRPRSPIGVSLWECRLVGFDFLSLCQTEYDLPLWEGDTMCQRSSHFMHIDTFDFDEIPLLPHLCTFLVHQL
jgi:hypothetical protein